VKILTDMCQKKIHQNHFKRFHEKSISIISLPQQIYPLKTFPLSVFLVLVSSHNRDKLPLRALVAHRIKSVAALCPPMEISDYLMHRHQKDHLLRRKSFLNRHQHKYYQFGTSSVTSHRRNRCLNLQNQVMKVCTTHLPLLKINRLFEMKRQHLYLQYIQTLHSKRNEHQSKKNHLILSSPHP